MINLILITHGDLAQSLVKTALSITGGEETGIFAFSRTGRIDPDQLTADVKNALAQGKDGTIVLSDLFGGSCTNMCAVIIDKNSNAVLISGANLNMVITFLHNRDKLDLNALAQKIEDDGKRGIININRFMNDAAAGGK